MLVFPKAKINLGLRITGKRTDGYHDIETVMYPVGLCDALELVPARESTVDSLTVTGTILPGRIEDNIVLGAVKALRKTHFFPFLKIHLHKIIPSGAGLGGGSSDAGSILRAINKMFSLSLGADELKGIAAGLGSDCPFFIDCKPAYATGRGEILTPVVNVLDGFYVVLLNPGISVSTKEAYGNCLPVSRERSLKELIEIPVHEWKDLIVNDFERTVFLAHPEIKAIKEALYSSGAVYSSMSGSGSTVYGIFKIKPEIHAALRKYLICEGIFQSISAQSK
jgi:4-diphosphocytidyl-2-C-methyl-D-erythritol kinase